MIAKAKDINQQNKCAAAPALIHASAALLQLLLQPLTSLHLLPQFAAVGIELELLQLLKQEG
jgi:hypothetical protein